MEYRALNTRYENLGRYDITRHKPFDYRKLGLLKQVLPKTITSTKNRTTKLILESIEHVFLFLISYVDDLKNFKNPFYKRF